MWRDRIDLAVTFLEKGFAFQLARIYLPSQLELERLAQNRLLVILIERKDVRGGRDQTP